MEDEIYQAALEANEAGYSGAAVVLFERCLQIRPDHSLARYLYAENLLAIGRVSDAERNLSMITGNPPGKDWLLDIMRGNIGMKRGDFRTAESSFRTTANKNPVSTVALTHLAECLAKQERFQEAYDVLSSALTASGDLFEVYLNLGRNKRALGDYTGARHCLVKALEFARGKDKRAERDLEDLDFVSKKEPG